MRQGIRAKVDPAGSATKTLRDALRLDSESEEEKEDKPAQHLAASPSLAVVSQEFPGRMVEVRVRERLF